MDSLISARLPGFAPRAFSFADDQTKEVLGYYKKATERASSDGSAVREFTSSVLTLVLAMITDQDDLDADVLDIPLPPVDPEDQDPEGKDKRLLRWKSKAEAFVDSRLQERPRVVDNPSSS